MAIACATSSGSAGPRKSGSPSTSCSTQDRTTTLSLGRGRGRGIPTTVHEDQHTEHMLVQALQTLHCLLPSSCAGLQLHAPTPYHRCAHLRCCWHSRPCRQVASQNLMQVHRCTPARAVHALVHEGPQCTLNALLVALWDLGAVKAQRPHNLHRRDTGQGLSGRLIDVLVRSKLSTCLCTPTPYSTISTTPRRQQNHSMVAAHL